MWLTKAPEAEMPPIGLRSPSVRPAGGAVVTLSGRLCGVLAGWPRGRPRPAVWHPARVDTAFVRPTEAIGRR